MRNKLTDLNNHLFAQLERLGDEELSQEELDKEIQRAKAINGVANNIINNARIALDGSKFAYQFVSDKKQLPEQFQQKEVQS